MEEKESCRPDVGSSGSGGSAGVVALVGIAYGAVISGNFFGWQLTLAGGFWNAVLVLAVNAVFFLGLSLCIAEVAAALPSCNSPSQFVRECLGSRMALTVSIAETIKIVLVVNVITVGIASYIGEIFQYNTSWYPLVWFLTLSADGLLLAFGGSVSLKMQLCFSLISALLLAIFYVGALVLGPDMSLALDGNVSSGPVVFSRTPSAQGFFYALPFGMWWYLGMEELPLSRSLARETRLLTPALLWAFGILTCTAILTLFLTSTVPPGAAQVSIGGYPLLDGYFSIFGETDTVRYACVVLLFGLVASLHAFAFAAAETLSRSAEDGFAPRLFEKRLKNGAPFIALTVALTMSYIALMILYFALGRDETKLGAVLIAAVLSASIYSYLAQLACFAKIRLSGKHGRYAPPANDRSPLGLPGAIISAALAIMAFAAIIFLCVLDIHYAHGVALVAAVALLWLTVHFILTRYDAMRVRRASTASSRSADSDPPPNQSLSLDHSIGNV